MLTLPLATSLVKSVSCGAKHTVVVTDSGKAFSFGKDHCGQLGIGTVTSGDHEADQNLFSDVPWSMVGNFGGVLPTRKAASVSCGSAHTMVSKSQIARIRFTAALRSSSY